MMDRVRRFGMRLVGPNCMGLLNTTASYSMNATFAPTMPPPGSVSMLSQSGAMGVTILDYAEGAAAHEAGRISDGELQQLQRCVMPGSGTCGGEYAKLCIWMRLMPSAKK